MSDGQKVSAARFFGGGGGRILLCAMAMACVTYLISIEAFKSDYHMAGVVIGFGVLSGSVVMQDIIKALEILRNILTGKKSEGNDESNGGSDKS